MSPVVKPLVLFMAGGTGGHVYPALAVAIELLARGYQVAWLGTERGLEARVIPAAGIPLHALSVRGVRGKNLWHKALAVGALVRSLIQALVLVRRLGPDCVVGMGGYAAGPGGVAAWLLRKPLLIHEQNAVAGTTNRLLAPLATRVLAGFPGAFKASTDVQVVGNPVRSDLVSASALDAYDYNGERPLRLLVLGGSLGAKPINELVPGVIRHFDTSLDIEVLHQCGDAHNESVSAAYGDTLGSGVRVVPFIEDMASAYAWADLVLCRAGALTIAELAVMGRPSLLVPLPHAIDDHQTYNARSLSDCDAGVLLEQRSLSEDGVVTLLRSYIEQPAQLRSMAAAAKAAGNAKATQIVSDNCEVLINEQ